MAKDKFIAAELDVEGWVEVALLGGFRNMKALMSDQAVIVEARRPSKNLDVTSDGFRARWLRGQLQKWINQPTGNITFYSQWSEYKLEFSIKYGRKGVNRGVCCRYQPQVTVSMPGGVEIEQHYLRFTSLFTKINLMLLERGSADEWPGCHCGGTEVIEKIKMELS
jgi:hypothetical protein